MTIAASAPAQVYKWVDERGVTHYGERPPMGGKATEVPNRLASPAPGAAASPAAAEAKDSGRVAAPQRDSILRQSPTAPEKPEDKKKRELARRQAQCNQQRELLTRLRQSASSFTAGAKGERTRVDNSEAIARQEKMVAEQCRG
jgi:hypothetical protein